MKKITYIFISLFAIISCGNKPSGSEKSVIAVPSEQNVTSAEAGKKVYDSVCMACHMKDGKGIPKMHPPLIESDFVNGDKEKLIGIVLNGLSGKMVIKGVTYNGIMPPNKHLSDKQIADVLTYVRSSFGNTSSAITVEEVQKVRASK